MIAALQQADPHLRSGCFHTRDGAGGSLMKKPRAGRSGLGFAGVDRGWGYLLNSAIRFFQSVPLGPQVFEAKAGQTWVEGMPSGTEATLTAKWYREKEEPVAASPLLTTGYEVDRRRTQQKTRKPCCIRTYGDSIFPLSDTLSDNLQFEIGVRRTSMIRNKPGCLKPVSRVGIA